MKYALTLIQYPSGRWGYAGKVPARLAYVWKDGSLLKPADVEYLACCSNPGFQFKTRTFETPEEAQAIAAQEGAQ